MSEAEPMPPDEDIMPPEPEPMDPMNNPLDDGFGMDMDNDLYSQQPYEKHDALLTGLTDFDPFIKDKINGYLGLVWDENQKEYIRDPEIDPVMNRKGAMWLIDNLRIYARKNNIITFIRPDHYKVLLENIIDVLWFGFAPRARKHFGVLSTGDLLRVCSELEDACSLVLMGAGDGKVMGFLEGTTRYNASENAQGPGQDWRQQTQTPGFWNRVKGVFKPQNSY